MNRRAIKSFVFRSGRITRAQKRGLENHFDSFGVLPMDSPPDWHSIFGRRAPLIVEIGSGLGEATLAIAEANPECNCAAVEVYPPGVGALLNEIAARKIKNIRVIRGDAAAVLRAMFEDSSIAAVHIFFPDPWPKKRHHKRRLIQDEFAELLAQKVSPGGIVRIATDCENYAGHIAQVFARARDAFSPQEKSENEFFRPPTRFENRARLAARTTAEFAFARRC